VALFGTDGIRGLANVDLTAELALDVAVAAAHILVESLGDTSKRPHAIVGQDSRASGEFLEAAVVAGLTSAGVDVYRVGVLPTPAIAFLVAETGADLGVMISASHNPAPDNGIKLFARGGEKLADSLEAAIEARMGEPWQRPTGKDVGRVIEDTSAREKYIAHLLKSVDTALTGLKVVVDCAHGAAASGSDDEGDSDASCESVLASLVAQRDAAREKHRSLLRAHHARFHAVWGRLLKTGYQNSRYAHQIERFACLYTSHVSNLAAYSPDKSWRAAPDAMAHEEDPQLGGGAGMVHGSG
jgi:hypothetical protein